jgi:hypothetical protein
MLAAALLCLGVVASSPFFGRAHPEGVFRPPAPAIQLTGRCSPLPDGVQLDFPHQVRSDVARTRGRAMRRVVRVQFDLIGADEVESQVAADLVAAGFREETAPEDSHGQYRYFRRDGYGVIGMAVEALWAGHDDAIVRGVMKFKLPRSTVRRQPHGCPSPVQVDAGAAARSSAAPPARLS